MPLESTKQGSLGISKTKAAITEHAWVCARSSTYMLWLLVSCFSETPDNGRWGVCIWCLLLRSFFSYCIASSRLDVRIYVLFYLLLLYWVDILEGLLLGDTQQGVYQERREVRGVMRGIEGGETVVRRYYLREEHIKFLNKETMHANLDNNTQQTVCHSWRRKK